MTARDPLEQLARLYGVQSTYTDISRRRRRTRRAALVAVLRSLGAPIEATSDAPDAVRARRQELAGEMLEPVTVAWDGVVGPIRVRVPTRMAERRIRASIVLEDGGERATVDTSASARAGPPGTGTVERWLRWDDATVPHGYHQVVVEVGAVEASTLLVSAPRRPAERAHDPEWGVFLPLYAVRSRRNWGIGDLTDLGDLVTWAGGLGASVVATLPLLASFLGTPFEPSPYSPASRLFWNEIYVDPEQAPEFDRTPEAKAAVRSAAFRRAVADLRSDPLVDYERGVSLKRQVMEPMARTFFDGEGVGLGAFRRFLQDNDAAMEYATFRAIGERLEKPFALWPEAERGRTLPRRRVDEPARRYHLYVQWLASRQIEAVAARGAETGAGLYFDFPVGVNPDGYDVWRERDAFLAGASAGAPPDPFFTGGQDWGFPPLHPEGIRRQRYRYLISCFRHLMRHGSVFRIDHVMGLHRMFVVPHGFGPLHGAYVRYRPEEQYAILAVESGRHGALVVGEDLGVVPRSIRQALGRHGIYRSHVLQMELSPDPATALRPPPVESVASLNTHDMATFAAFWNDADMALRLERGWLTEGEARHERTRRERLRSALVARLRRDGRLGSAGGRTGGRRSLPAPEDVLAACLGSLADGPARMLLVNLEDLWLEDRPQNVPGTTDEYPNWRRKARYTRDEFAALPSVVGTLNNIDSRRRRAGTR